MNLTASDWIALIGIVLSTVVSTTSIIIAVLSLRQNSKMIRESTRPNVTIYFTTIHVADAKGYFVLKNFGQTGAYITKFSYDEALKSSRYNDPELVNQLDLIKGMYLAPQQKQVFMYCPKELPEHTCRFQIEYTDKLHSYNETVEIDVSAISDIAKYRNTTTGKELRNISKAFEEIVERSL